MINENISVFDLFKIGVEPSSSYTLGLWRAPHQFLQSLARKKFPEIKSITVYLYGSSAKTGKRHRTDTFVMLGLSGYDPLTIDTLLIP